MAQRIVNGRPVQTQLDARGLDYFVNAQGEQEYLLPDATHPTRQNKPKNTQFTIQDWDARTGTWKLRRNWDGIGTLAGSLAAGGIIAAPAIGAAVGGASAAGAAGGGAGATGAGSASLGGLYSAAPAIASQGVSAGGGMGAKSLLGGLWGGIKNIAPHIKDIAGTVSGAAQGAREGRQQDTTNQLLLQQLAQQNANAANQNAVARATFGAGERDASNRRALMVGLLGGVQDVNIGRPEGSTIPTFNVAGGLRPSALSPEVRAAIMQQLSQGPMEAPPFRETPNMTLPQQGTGEKLLGGVGLVGGLLGGLGGLLGNRQQPASPPTPVDLSQTNPLVFSKKPYQGLFAPAGGLA